MTLKDPSELAEPGSQTDVSNQTWDEVVAEGDTSKIRDRLQGELTDLLNKWSRRLQGYTVLVLYNDATIDDEDADRIYQALRSIKPNQRKDVLLVLVSSGGYVVPAYQISKLCREWAKDKFLVGVPRHAKSAATMICLGADAVHMGPLGHLGPIDPQIKGVSGLAHKYSLEMITRWAAELPAAQGLWSDILSRDESFDYFDIGDFDRIVKSSVQYAERLLVNGKSDPERAAKIARHLVYYYEDHGFAIDRDETREIFGEASVVQNSNELSFSEETYRLISRVDKALQRIELGDGIVMQSGITAVGSFHDCVSVIPPTIIRRRIWPRTEGGDEGESRQQ
jgi:membrane-bound ClpP family serine protease